MKRFWELKQSADPQILEMYIYGDVQSDYFSWDDWKMHTSETSADYFRNELAKHPDVNQINIYINSYGGSVFEGTAIYNQLKRHPAQKTVFVDGFACSVAATIAMCADKVIMPKNSMMMIHEAWSVAVGNVDQLRKSADDLEAINEGNRQAYLQKSNGKISEDKLQGLLKAETWLTAEQCIEYGFADEYAENDADLTKAKQMLEKVNQSLEQHISYNKAISAQLRQLVEQQEPPEEPEGEKPKQKTFFNFKEEK